MYVTLDSKDEVQIPQQTKKEKWETNETSSRIRRKQCLDFQSESSQKEMDEERKKRIYKAASTLARAVTA